MGLTANKQFNWVARLRYPYRFGGIMLLAALALAIPAPSPANHSTLITPRATYVLWQFSSPQSLCPQYYMLAVKTQNQKMLMARKIKSCTGIIKMFYSLDELAIQVPTSDPTNKTFFYSYRLKGNQWIDDGRL